MGNLVTGGAGFIGSAIVDKLVENGEKTIIVDNLSRGTRDNLNAEAQFYEIDITNTENLKNVFCKYDINCVYHQAAQADAALAMNEPAFDAKSNILGTVNLLEMCVECDVDKIVYASSAAVYGTPAELPLQENHPLAPESPYGASKLTPEHYLKIYKEQYDLDYTALRYANVYGPRQFAGGEGGVIAIFINRILQGEPPIIYGDGQQTRDFIYVEDIARANLAAMESIGSGIFNISCCQQTSLLELVEKLKKIADKDFGVKYDEPRKGDIRHSCLSNKKAKERLDWQPQYNLEAGLKQTVEYYKTSI